MSISIATQKELNHSENVRKEVLGEAKNHNQISLAYKLCPKSQAFVLLVHCCKTCDLKVRMTWLPEESETLGQLG